LRIGFLLAVNIIFLQKYSSPKSKKKAKIFGIFSEGGNPFSSQAAEEGDGGSGEGTADVGKVGRSGG
jgi:hypothetical protein